MTAVGAEDHAVEALASIDRHVHLGPRLVPGVIAFQSFARVSGRSMPALLISSVQADLMMSATSRVALTTSLICLAILDRDERPIGAVRHHLHGRALAAQHLDADDLETPYAPSSARSPLTILASRLVCRADGSVMSLSSLLLATLLLSKTRKGGLLGPPSKKPRRMFSKGAT